MDYDASPHTVDRILPLEEVEALVADECRAVAKDKKKVVHLVKRMGATIQSHRLQVRSLSNDMQMLRLQQERAGQATTLHPRDAVRYLAPEVLSELVEGHLRERIAAVQRALADAQNTTQQAQRELYAAQHATALVLEDASVPAEIRTRIRYLMDQIVSGQDPQATASGPEAAGDNDGLDDLFS